jgi:predicted phage gp36 major capsid-like protein
MGARLAPAHGMRTNTMAEIRRLAEEIELEAHLARMEVRDRWTQLKPKVQELEHSIERAGRDAGRAIAKEATKLATALKVLRDEISDELHGAPATWQ